MFVSKAKLIQSEMLVKAHQLEIQRLGVELAYQKEATKEAQDRASVLQDRVDRAESAAEASRKETIDILKCMNNVQMLAAGSRNVMFTGVGPEIKPPKEFTAEQLKPIADRERAGSRARIQRSNFMQDFLKQQQQELHDAPIPDEPQEEAV